MSRHRIASSTLTLASFTLLAACGEPTPRPAQTPTTQAATVSNAWCAGSTAPSVAVVDGNPGFGSASEITSIANYLTDLGYSVTTLAEPSTAGVEWYSDPGITPAQIAAYDVIVYNTKGSRWHSAQTRETLTGARNAGKSLFLIGDDISWGIPDLADLTHLQSGGYSANGEYYPSNTVVTLAGTHPVLAGPSGPVGSITYDYDVDHAVATGQGEAVLATVRNGQPAVLAYEHTSGARVLVSLLGIQAAEGTVGSASSLQSLRRLLENGIAYLAARQPCDLVCAPVAPHVGSDGQSCVTAPVQQGFAVSVPATAPALTYVTLTATHGGEVPAGSTVSFTLGGQTAYGPQGQTAFPLVNGTATASVFTAASVGWNVIGEFEVVATLSSPAGVVLDNATTSIQLEPQSSTLSLLAQPNPAVAFQQMRLYGFVATSAGSLAWGSDSAKVTFVLDGVQLNPAVVMGLIQGDPSPGPTFTSVGRTFVSLPAGLHTLSATYSAGPFYGPTLQPSSAGPITFEVAKAATECVVDLSVENQTLSIRSSAIISSPSTMAGGSPPDVVYTCTIDGQPIDCSTTEDNTVPEFAMTTGTHVYELTYAGSSDFLPCSRTVSYEWP